MSLFSEKMPQWDNTGVEPSSTKKTNGWGFKEKPPFEFFNWLFNRIYKCIQEIRTVTDTQVTNINSSLASKVNKDELLSPLTAKDGVKTWAQLQAMTTGNTVGDYYYCSDGDGTNPAGNYRWTGSNFTFGGTGDEGYNILKTYLSNVSNEVNYMDKFTKQGRYDTNGILQETTSTSWISTELLNISHVGMISYTLFGFYLSSYPPAQPNVLYFNENKQIISFVTCNATSDFQQNYSKIIKVPTNAYYVAFTTKTSELNNNKCVGFGTCDRLQNEINKNKKYAIDTLIYNLVNNTIYDDGYFFYFADGGRLSNTEYTNTGFLLAHPNYRYTVPENAQTCFFDVNFDYITGSTATSTISPSNTVYMIVSFKIADKSIAVINGEIVNEITVGTNGDFSNFISGLSKANELHVPLYVKSGTYDLVAEGVDVNSDGLYAMNDIHGVGTVNIIANLTTLNKLFSPINFSADYESIKIDNIHIITSNSRYSIHDEMGINKGTGKSYNHKVSNCILENNTIPSTEWASPRAIGIGMGDNGNIEIDNCITECNVNVENHTDIDAHSGFAGQTTNSKITIKNCISRNGTYSVTAFGDNSAFKNIGVITNCYVKYEPAHYNSGGYDNFELIKYNNVAY